MSILTQVSKKEKKKETPLTKINDRLDREIEQIYSRLRGNLDNTKSLTEERHEYILKLAKLYEDKVKLGTLQIKKYQIGRQLFKDMRKEHVPILSYVVMTTILPKKYKRPYHWRKIDATHAEVMEIVDDTKMAISKTIEEVDTGSYSADGTHKEISEMMFREINDSMGRIDGQDLNSLSPDMVKEMYDCIKDKTEVIKKYCKLYNIKIDDTDDRESSISLTGDKPKYYKNDLLDNEIHLAEKDLSVIRKKLSFIPLSEEDKYIAWEAVRAFRLWLRPQVNDKYRRDWNGYAKIIDILDRKGISGVAKETKSTVKIYDKKTQKFVDMYEIVKTNPHGLSNKQIIKLKKRMKGITRNHLRNMLPKCNRFYVDFITDFPFLQQFSALFEKYLQPVRDGKALLVSDKH